MESVHKFVDQLIACNEKVNEIYTLSEDIFSIYNSNEIEKKLKKLNHIEAELNKIRTFIYTEFECGRILSRRRASHSEQRIPSECNKEFNREKVRDYIFYNYSDKILVKANPQSVNSFHQILDKISGQIYNLLVYFIPIKIFSQVDEETLALEYIGVLEKKPGDKGWYDYDPTEQLSSTEKAEYYHILVENNRIFFIKTATRFTHQPSFSKLQVQIAAIYSIFDEFNKKIMLSAPSLVMNKGEMITIRDLTLFGGYAFEAYLCVLFQKMGFTSVQTLKSRDQGCDLVISKDGLKYVIQAKNHRANISNSAIQEIGTAIKMYGAAQGIVIITSEFTKAARDLAEVNDIHLINGNDLSKLMLFFPILREEIA